MSTTKTRVNVSILNDVKKALDRLAKRDHMPTVTKAMRLIEIGLENEEDEVWHQIAAQRDKRNSTFHSHSEAFGP